MTKSYSIRVLIGIFLPLIFLLALIAQALSLHESNYRFFITDNRLTAQSKSTDGQPLVVEKFVIFNKNNGQIETFPRTLPELSWLVMEEPDVFPTYSQQDELFQHLETITQTLNEQRLAFTSAEKTYPVLPVSREIKDLPLMFWFQAAAGMLTILVCTLVALAGQKGLGKTGFIITGIGYAGLTFPSALYGSRSLFINAESFKLLSITNQVSTTVFMAGMALFLSNHPRRMQSRLFLTLLATSSLTGSLSMIFRWPDNVFLSLYIPFIVQMALCIIAGVWQWRSSSQRKSDRSSVRWILLFLTATLVPTLLKQLAPEIPQAVLISSFSIIYTGILFAVIQHQFFEIERWSYILWGWLLGGLAVLTVDIVLATFIATSSETTFVLALMVVGALYFPLRQTLWHRLFIRESNGLQRWLSKALPELLSKTDEQYPQQRIINAFQAVFEPLDTRLSKVPTLNDQPKLSKDRTSLSILLPNQERLQIFHPDQGRRLFSRADIHDAALVIDLNKLISRSMNARAEGAQDERDRMRRDLHDELGAKLLRLLYRSPEENRPLVREAINELRNLVRSRSEAEVNVQSALIEWRKEAELRCGDLKIKLNWQQQTISGELRREAFEHTALTLREAISNAIRNHKTPNLDIQLYPSGNDLIIVLKNDSLPSAVKSGMGISNMQQRMQLIEGQLEISTTSREELILWHVALRIPLIETQSDDGPR